MSSVRSWPSLGGDKEPVRAVSSAGDIVKMGYLKKLKTMKKKFFVLRGDSAEASACLEYYDSEKKFKSNHAPKRSIALKTCFNINKRSDTRQKWVIALYTKNDCFCLVMETEEELEDWLKMLLTLQHGEDVPDGEQPKPIFEHVWHVDVQKKELGHSRNILGPYRLCLTDRTLSLVKMDPDSDKQDTIEFSLQSIRRCGDLESFFYMEVGQMSVTGAGNLWMRTEDNIIAQNMHAAILSACRNCKDVVPILRNRSHSTNESSRPTIQRSSHDGHSRWTGHSEEISIRPMLLKSLSVGPAPGCVNINNRTVSTASTSMLLSISSAAIYSTTSTANNSATVNDLSSASHSAANNNNSNYNNYNNNNNSAVAVTSSGTGVCGGNAGGGVVVGMHQRTYSFPLSPIPPSRRASTESRPNKKPSMPHSLSGVRERCDSLPSRPRTTSEGASHIPHHHRHIYLQPSLIGPHPMYNKSISYSPPVVDSSPVSPESRGFSTDSAGSSLSMEGDGMEMGSVSWDGGVDKYGHSLTPDEPVILEENADDENVHWSRDDYVAPDKHMCLTINNHLLHKNSPNPSSCGFKSSSPSQGSLADMCSPCGSSPLESSAYMTMSSADKPIVSGNNYSGYRSGLAGGSSSVNHSRGSSLAEDGYVHMAPTFHDDGYIDMEPGGHNRRNTDHYRSGELSPASSCSITSGTPSTDIRFSEYTLDKVSTYITPSEDEITPSERPTRAYSVGSRPTFNKRNDVINQSDCQQRVRAFSVGSRFPRVHSAHLTPPPRHPLSSSHSSVEPSEDLMEIDFTKKSRTRNHSKKPSSSERLSVPPSSVASSAASSYSTAEGSYMEMSMSPRGSPKPSDNEMDNSQFCPSPPKNSRIPSCIGRSPPKSYLDMKPNFSSSSPPVSGLSSVPLYKVPEGDSSYMEMTSGNKGELLSGSSPPVLLNSIRDDRPHSPADSYVEMQPAKSVMAKTCAPRIDSFPVTEQLKTQNFPKVMSSPPIKPALMSTSNITKSKTTQEDYMDMNMKRKLSMVEDNNNKIMIGRTNPIDTPKKVPGYVEMTVGNPKPTRKPSLDNFKSGDFDYMNMSGNGKKERKGSRKGNRYSSQPIAIQSTVSKEQSSSTSPVFTIVGRKHSTGTPPKVPSYLPLGNFSTSPSSSPYSSLGRRSRKTPSRRESRELSSSGSSTPIFPLSLNSPSSPMKPLGPACNKDKDSYESAAKCPVDARSGTVRICYSPAENSTPSQSDQQQSSSCNISEKNEYVNFNPLMNEVKENNDYALMKPVNNPFEPSRKISAPPILNNVKSRSIDRIVLGVSNLAVSAPEINSVPINSNNDNVNNNNNASDFIETVNRTPNIVQSASSVNNLEAVPSAFVSSVYDSSNNNQDNSHSDSEVLSCAGNNAVFSDNSSAAADVPKVANNSSVPITLSSSASTSLDCSYPVSSAAVSSNLAVAGNDSICRISHTCVPVAATTNTFFSSSNTGGSTTVVNTCSTSAVGDKELHYASLDLARSDSIEDSSGNSNTNNSLPMRNQSSTSSASTPSPNIGQNVAPTLTYAEIDFSKSNCSNANSPVH